ncbi:MAG: hypothetical protein R3F59_31195 [Myxococcota bacterium]
MTPRPPATVYNVTDGHAPTLAEVLRAVGAPPPDGSLTAPRWTSPWSSTAGVARRPGFAPRFPHLAAENAC